jgi:hypothetical protein
MLLGALLALAVTGHLFAGPGAFAAECPEQIDEATQLGQQVLALRAALHNPDAPDAMRAVTSLGLDSRHYVMVWGWLSQQLQGDRSIADAASGKVSPELERRIDFLERAIRAIDLE